jgi:hypothetical protein
MLKWILCSSKYDVLYNYDTDDFCLLVATTCHVPIYAITLLTRNAMVDRTSDNVIGDLRLTSALTDTSATFLYPLGFTCGFIPHSACI